MRSPCVEFFETFKAVQSAGIVVTHARLFGIVVRDALVTFDDGFDRCLPLGSQPAKFFARNQDLLIESFGLRAAFGVSRGGAFAFARQTFGLLSQLLERMLQLTSQLIQSFYGCGMGKQFRPGTLDLVFCQSNFT